VKHKPGGGNVQIFNERVVYSSPKGGKTPKSATMKAPLSAKNATTSASKKLSVDTDGSSGGKQGAQSAKARVSVPAAEEDAPRKGDAAEEAAAADGEAVSGKAESPAATEKPADGGDAAKEEKAEEKAKEESAEKPRDRTASDSAKPAPADGGGGGGGSDNAAAAKQEPAEDGAKKEDAPSSPTNGDVKPESATVTSDDIEI